MERRKRKTRKSEDYEEKTRNISEARKRIERKKRKTSKNVRIMKRKQGIKVKQGKRME